MKLDQNTMFVAAIALFLIGGLVFLFGLVKRPGVTVAPSYVPVQTFSPVMQQVGPAPTMAPTMLAGALPNGQMPVNMVTPQQPPVGQAVMSPSALAPVGRPVNAQTYGGQYYYGQGPPAQQQTVPVQYTRPVNPKNPRFMNAPQQVSPVYTDYTGA